LLVDARAQPVSGDADVVLHVPAADPALGLHVPVRGHARRGAVARRGVADDALPEARARDHAARRDACGALAVADLARRLHPGAADDCGFPRAQTPRLKADRRQRGIATTMYARPASSTTPATTTAILTTLPNR